MKNARQKLALVRAFFICFKATKVAIMSESAAASGGNSELPLR